MRLECQQIYTENQRLRDEYKQLKQLSSPKKFLELQKEVEHLHWQLNKMENSRKLYELATGQLVTFLEQVSGHELLVWNLVQICLRLKGLCPGTGSKRFTRVWNGR